MRETRFIIVLSAAVILTLAAVFGVSIRGIREAKELYAQRLMDRATRVSEAISVPRIRELAAQQNASDSPGIQRIIHYLTWMRDSEPGCRRIYLLFPENGGNFRFFTSASDGQSTEDARVAPPMLVNFASPKSVYQGSTHASTPITIQIPIIDPRSDRIMAVYGLEFSRQEMDDHIGQMMMPTLFFAISLLMIAAAGITLLVLRNKGRFESRNWSSYIEPVLVILIGMILTIHIARAAYRGVMEQTRTKFEQLAHTATAGVMQRLEHIRDTHMATLTRFFESSSDVSLDEFLHFTEPLLDDRSIYAWSWVPMISPEDRPRMAAQLREMGVPMQDIWDRAEDGTRRPSGDRPYYAPVLYMAPPESNQSAIGFDQTSEPNRRAAIESALQSGMPTATPPITMVHRDDVGRVMIVYYPTRTPKGWVAFVLELNKLIPSQHETAALRFECRLVNEKHDGELISQTDNISATSSEMTLTRPLCAFGFLFRIVAYPDDSMRTDRPLHASLTAAASSGLLTIAIALLIGAPLRRQRELEKLVRERTEELRNKEHLFRTITESMRDVVWVAEVEEDRTRYSYISPSCQRLFGIRPEDFIGHSLEMRVRPEDQAAIRQSIGLILSDYRMGRFPPTEHITREVCQVHQNGSLIWTEISASLRTNPETGRIEIWGLTRDISGRKRAYDELQENKRFLLALIENSGALIFVKDTNGLYRLVNSQWERVTGFTRDRVLGRSDADIFSSEDAESFSRADREVLRSINPMEFEEVLHAPNGTRHFLTIKFPLRDAKGAITGICGMAVETTAMKLADERVRAHLNESARLHAVTMGREARVLELKREVDALRARLGEPPKYREANQP